MVKDSKLLRSPDLFPIDFLKELFEKNGALPLRCIFREEGRGILRPPSEICFSFYFTIKTNLKIRLKQNFFFTSNFLEHEKEKKKKIGKLSVNNNKCSNNKKKHTQR